MSRSPNSISDLCQPSHLKRFTLPVEAIIDVVLYDAFIVCLEMLEQHLKLAVFDRITSKEISTLEILIHHSKLCNNKLVRLHNWSVGFISFEDNCIVGNEVTFPCFLHTFSIDQVGHLEKLTPIHLLSSPFNPQTVNIYTSSDKNNDCVMVFSVYYWGNDHQFEEAVNDISETKKFPVVSAPTLIIKKGHIRFVAGRTLWVQHHNRPGADEVKQYDLLTGEIFRSLELECLPRKPTLFRNRFCVSFDMSMLHIFDIFTGEFVVETDPQSSWNHFKEDSIECSFLQWEDIESCDVSNDGFLLFKTYRANIFTCRLDVPSLADIAKEIIHKSDHPESLEDEDGEEEDTTNEEQEDEASTDFDDEENEEDSSDEEEEISTDSDDDEPVVKRTRQSQAE